MLRNMLQEGLTLTPMADLMAVSGSDSCCWVVPSLNPQVHLSATLLGIKGVCCAVQCSGLQLVCVLTWREWSWECSHISV